MVSNGFEIERSAWGTLQLSRKMRIKVAWNSVQSEASFLKMKNLEKVKVSLESNKAYFKVNRSVHRASSTHRNSMFPRYVFSKLKC